jgi:CheY-like chemotaxis protein
VGAGVVLCDIGLPGMDGYAVVRELRRNPVTAGARVVALTGYGQEGDRRRADGGFAPATQGLEQLGGSTLGRLVIELFLLDAPVH